MGSKFSKGALRAFRLCEGEGAPRLTLPDAPYPRALNTCAASTGYQNDCAGALLLLLLLLLLLHTLPPLLLLAH